MKISELVLTDGLVNRTMIHEGTAKIYFTDYMGTQLVITLLDCRELFKQDCLNSSIARASVRQTEGRLSELVLQDDDLVVVLKAVFRDSVVEKIA